MGSVQIGASGGLLDAPWKTSKRTDHSPGHHNQSHSRPNDFKTNNEEVLYRCQHCGCGFKTVKSRLKHHLERCFKHSTSKMKVGTYLPNSYMNGTNIGSSSQGPGEAMHCSRSAFKCSLPTGTKSCKSSLDFEAHFSRRHEQRNFICDHPSCVKTFSNARALGKHKRNVHAKRGHVAPNLNCSFRTNPTTSSADHLIVHEGRNAKILCSKGQVGLVDSTGFACMLCDFVGYGEEAALDHVKCHWHPAYPVDKLYKSPVISFD